MWLLLLVTAMGVMGGGFLLLLLDMSGNDLAVLGLELLTLSGPAHAAGLEQRAGWPRLAAQGPAWPSH